nr:hypothetical transcript [Hymenolepis microstoma]
MKTSILDQFHSGAIVFNISEVLKCVENRNDETTRLGKFRLQSRLPEPLKGAWEATILNGDVGALCRSTEPAQLYFVSNCTGGPQLAAPREVSQDIFSLLVTCRGDRKALVFKQDMDETSETSKGRRPAFQWDDISESNCSFKKV